MSTVFVCFLDKRLGNFVCILDFQFFINQSLNLDYSSAIAIFSANQMTNLNYTAPKRGILYLSCSSNAPGGVAYGDIKGVRVFVFRSPAASSSLEGATEFAIHLSQGDTLNAYFSSSTFATTHTRFVPYK